MLAVVKTPHINFRIEGQIPKKLLQYLKHEYGSQMQLILDDAIKIKETEWYQKMKSQDHPGQVLQVYRQNAKLTQQAMGEILGVSKSRISDYEHNRRSMSKEIVKKIAGYFKVPMERLL